MPCYHPLSAFRAPGGGVTFKRSEGYVDRPVSLPCGQCRGCRLQRSRDWALRIVHEAKLHPASCFVTLTYDDDHLPADGSLDVAEFQQFARNLRKRIGRFRYYQCGEYGEQTNRPHYHVCLFGSDFAFDRSYHSDSRAQGDRLYTSPTLEKAWGKGFAPLGDLTWQSAAYVARYCMKKITGPMAEESYQRIDAETGEVLNRVRPPFATMSLKPGIGRGWLDKYHTDVYPSDEVVHDGKKHRPPRYYDKQLEKDNPELLVQLKQKRLQAAARHKDDLTSERLAVRETVAASRINTLKRNL